MSVAVVEFQGQQVSTYLHNDVPREPLRLPRWSSERLARQKLHTVALCSAGEEPRPLAALLTPGNGLGTASTAALTAPEGLDVLHSAGKRGVLSCVEAAHGWICNISIS